MTALLVLKRFTPLLALGLALSLSACLKPAVDAEKQKQDSVAFLSQNAGKPGIITTASGLQYQVLKEGQGARPQSTDTVTVNYRGSLIDGKVFDTGEGISFPLNHVIAGWTEGLQLMKEGSQYRFFIPADLAYGDTGAGGVIPPHAALVFEVDLVRVGPP